MRRARDGPAAVCVSRAARKASGPAFTVRAGCERAGDAPFLLDAVAAAPAGGCALVVGPEGGLADEDLAAIRLAKPDAVPVSLGDAVLRAETACWAALALAGAGLRAR